MTAYDPEAFLAPLEGDSPTGADLEYDPDFLALERAAAPRAERAIGDSIKAAEEPDWDEVITLATGLLERSRDLRVAVHMANAWMRTGGLGGWAAGLALIQGLLEQHWEGVHPQLDAEDDDDPTARVNAVAAIANPLSLLGQFRTVHFVQSPRVGRFSLRDLRIANGNLKVEPNGDTPLPSMTEIEACCLDCPEDQLTGALEAVSRALEHAKAIDQVFNDRVGTAGPDLRPLLSDTYELKKFLEAQVARRNPAAADEASDEGDTAGAGTQGGRTAATGRIETPQDVLRRLDELCDYYARCEPSSPVPLLLRRAQRLVGKNFLDLLKDLAPGGVSEMEVISGATED